MRKKLKSLPPGADAGVPYPTPAQKKRPEPKPIRVNPVRKDKVSKGWVS